MNSNRYMNRKSFSIFVLIVILIQQLGFQQVRDAKADEPVTVAIAAAAAGTVVGWALNRIFGSGKEPATHIEIDNAKNKIIINNSNGLSLQGSGPVVNWADADKFLPTGTDNSVLNIPTDLSPSQTFPNGVVVNGAVGGAVNNANDTFSFSNNNMQVAGNIFAWQADPNAGFNEMSLALITSGSATYLRPSSQNGQAADFNYSLSLGDIGLGTSVLPGTDATVTFLVNISSPELGLLFQGTASIGQGDTAAVLTGDLLGLPFVVASPGNASLTNFDDTLTAVIPTSLDEFTVTYSFGYLSQAVVVPLPPALLLMGSGLVALFGCSTSRHGRRTSALRSCNRH